MSYSPSQNSSRLLFQQPFEYSIPPTSLFTYQTQRQCQIRQASINRNTSISSSMIVRPGKILQNNMNKNRRQNSIKNSDFKQNDPYYKHPNMIDRNCIKNQRILNNSQYVSQYQNRNSYMNPMAIKKEKITREQNKQISRQQSREKRLTVSDSRQTSITDHSIHFNLQSQYVTKAQFEQLHEKVMKMQTLIQSNSSNLSSQSSSLSKQKQKLQKLQQSLLNSQKLTTGQVLSNIQSQKRYHQRSISTTSSSPASFKQLNDIMSLIQQTKNYQIKNSQQYRKMIEQFRSTILEFRDQINKTVKKTQFDGQIGRIKDILMASYDHQSNALRKSLTTQFNNLSKSTTSQFNNLSKSNANQFNSLRKSTSQFNSSNLNQPIKIYNNHQNHQKVQRIQKTIQQLRNSIDKLEDNNVSLRAQIVKLNVKDKKAFDQTLTKISQLTLKVNKCSQSSGIFDQQLKKGRKFQGKSICFSVTQQLIKYFDSPANRTKTMIQSQKCLTIKQKIYYIDVDGYLMDKDNFYLLNDNNQQIRLSQKQIEALKFAKIMN